METFYITGGPLDIRMMVSKMLASRKCIQFIELSEIVEKECGKKLSDMNSTEDRQIVIEKTKEALNKIIKDSLIITLNNICISDIEIRHYIKRTGRVIYLRTENENDTREYNEELSNYYVDIDNKNVEEIFKDILAIYNLVTKIKCHIYIK